MENLAAHEFIERREAFFRLRASNEQEGVVAVQSLFNWVMSTIESLYWSDDLTHIAFDINLYAKGNEVILVHIDRRSCQKLKFRFRQGYNGHTLNILRDFVALFNETNFSKHKYRFSWPSFHAFGPSTCESSDFPGDYYSVYIHIDMRRDIKDEFRA